MTRSGGLERLRSTEVKTLREIDAVFAQQIQRFAVLDTFGDCLLTEPVSDDDDRLDEVLVRCVGDEIADKLDVDLDVCDMELLQVGEASVAGAEVVERHGRAK